MSDLDTIKNELEQDSRFEVSETNGIVSVNSDDWAEVPASGVEPSSVLVSKASVDGCYDVRPVDSGGERFELTADEVVLAVKGYLKGEEMY